MSIVRSFFEIGPKTCPLTQILVLPKLHCTENTIKGQNGYERFCFEVKIFLNINSQFLVFSSRSSKERKRKWGGRSGCGNKIDVKQIRGKLFH